MRCFNLALISRMAVDHRPEGTCLTQMSTLGSSMHKPTGGMRPEQQWPRSATSAPRRAPGNVPFIPGHVRVRGQKGHSSHKN